MVKSVKKISKSVAETEKIAKIFLDKIFKNHHSKNGALVVALSGDLGAGKTAFTKAIGKHLKIKNKIGSPTFVIMKKYSLKLKNYKFLFHIDAYRLKNEKELLHLGWEEIAKNKEHIVFVEWPENVSKIIPTHARYIYIETDEKGERSLELK